MFSLLKLFFSSSQKVVKPHTISETFGPCPKCGFPLAKRSGKFGEFIGCEGFPDCHYTEPIHAPVREFIGDPGLINIQKNLSIIHGANICFRCKRKTEVFGFALVLENTKFANDPRLSISDYGYDIFILPLSEIFTQLPKHFQDFILSAYPVKYRFSKSINETYLANICEHCQVLQGNNFIFDDTSHGSPFDPRSNEPLIIDKFPLKKSPFYLQFEIDSQISPMTNFKIRSKTSKQSFKV